MAARTTLATLITELRGMSNAGTADATLGTVDYWSDDHLQIVLDRHSIDVRREQLDARPTYLGGTAVYQNYYSSHGNLEATSGGTAQFVIEDGTGVDIGTALYTADYARGVVSFAANTLGTAYYLTGRSYDLNAAAADVWRTKAAQVANQFDVSTDNHSLSRSQLMAQAMQMCEYYSALAAPQVTTLVSDDYCN